LRASHGTIDASVLLGLGASAEGDLDARPSHHDSAEDHDHDDFESFDVALGEVADPLDLIARLKAAATAHDVLRIKGFIAVAGKDMRLVVQGVGPRFSHYYDRDWGADETRASRLVVIGETGLDRPAIAAAIAGPTSG
jgi:cobalamin biosynthesis protein CobW